MTCPSSRSLTLRLSLLQFNVISRSIIQQAHRIDALEADGTIQFTKSVALGTAPMLLEFAR
jgi:hypothetical protein